MAKRIYVKVLHLNNSRVRRVIAEIQQSVQVKREHEERERRRGGAYIEELRRRRDLGQRD